MVYSYNKMKESRVKKTLKNVRVNLVFFFLTLFVSFFSRKAFLDNLGADFIGLIGTLQNLLSYLNLAELGIATAIGYVLYEPLFAQNHFKINEIISVFGYLYRSIGRIVLLFGIILSLFIPVIFPNTKFELILIYFAYFSFLASSLIGYFINYKQTLLEADQRYYVIAGYYQGVNVIKTLVQIFFTYYTKNCFLWVAIELFFGILYSFVLNWKIARVYPWLNSDISEGRKLFSKYPEVMKYAKQLFVQKFSQTVQNWTVPILTYSFVSLQLVAYYGNYQLITDKMYRFVNAFLGNTNAGVGNLIAEGEKDKIINVFWELLSVRYWVSFVVGFGLFMLASPFITIWLGEKYVLNDTILMLIVISSVLAYLREGVVQFVNGYGLFYDVWASFAEITLNLGIAIYLGFSYGLEGILLGGIVSQLVIIGIWKPVFLYMKGFREPMMPYWINILKLLLILLTPAIFIVTISHCFIHLKENSWLHFMLYALIVVLAYFICSFICLFLFCSSFRNFAYRFLRSNK